MKVRGSWSTLLNKYLCAACKSEITSPGRWPEEWVTKLYMAFVNMLFLPVTIRSFLLPSSHTDYTGWRQSVRLGLQTWVHPQTAFSLPTHKKNEPGSEMVMGMTGCDLGLTGDCTNCGQTGGRCWETPVISARAVVMKSVTRDLPGLRTNIVHLVGSLIIEYQKY